MSTALKLPIFFFGKVRNNKLSGSINFEKGTVIKSGMIKFGNQSAGIFDSQHRTILNIHGTVVFGGSASFGVGSTLSIGPGSELRIGDNFSITGRSTIVASGKSNVSIGKDCLLSWDVLIMNTDFHKITENGVAINQPKDINIGNHVWIGARSLVLKGSVIPSGSVVGAASTVNKILEEEDCVYAGTPAKAVKRRIYWEK